MPRIAHCFKGMASGAMLALMVTLCGCAPSDGVPDFVASGLEEAVTAAVAESLVQGRFRLHGSPQGIDELSSDRASQLAAAFVSAFADYLSPRLEAEHGLPIAYHRLQPCERPLYARSSYQPLRGAVQRPTRGAIGAWWLVALCDAGTPAVGVAVSAAATDVSLTSQGTLDLATLAGNEFHVLGVRGQHWGTVSSPEEAAIGVHLATGRHVSSTPELIAPGLASAGPWNSWWRMTLDTPVRGRTTTGAREPLETDNVGIRGGLLVLAELRQPDTEELVEPVSGGGSSVRWVPHRIQRSPDIPVELSPAVMEGR